MKNRIILESHCDQSSYPLDSVPDGNIVRVSFREWNSIAFHGKRLETDVFEAIPARSYLRATKIGEPPTTPEDAANFTRAMFGYLHKAVWFHFVPANTLYVFPPPSSDGDFIVVEFEESQYAARPD